MCGPGIQVVNSEIATLLGSPIGVWSWLVLLPHAFIMPKLLYDCCTSPSFSSPVKLKEYDSTQCASSSTSLKLTSH